MVLIVNSENMPKIVCK